jgi:ATP diphosphatase
MTQTTGERFERAVAIMARLRGPGGCPWDREQNFDSIQPYTLEETYEVFEAIDNRDWNELPAELGDLLLQVLFYAQMGREDGTFSIDEVLDRLCDKLVRRHPHVFGDVKADTSGEVLRNWEAIKAQEKADQNNGVTHRAVSHDPASSQSILAVVSPGLPALLEAGKMSSRAAKAGFDWANVEQLFDKLNEEIEELRTELRRYPAPGPQPDSKDTSASAKAVVPEDLRHRMEDEVGDLFFVLVNISRFLALDSELALKKANRKFRRRFQLVEGKLRAAGLTFQEASLQELERLWQTVKREERMPSE